ncbi:shikimate kinase 2, chloroplastic-like [Camellia sinensis]|uniref:shikimate kinase 2, chloroplastic-like n=1 Tax=Camellia sinensis TaxID=4442 RepID=UPI0010365D4E|nr:shikimate kinase 2, chloroplastic-like [Camellia sinensis]
MPVVVFALIVQWAFEYLVREGRDNYEMVKKRFTQASSYHDKQQFHAVVLMEDPKALRSFPLSTNGNVMVLECMAISRMMGSGKTTVGKILSEALAYSFVDSDKYVEEALGGSPVAQIFNQFGESFFRDYESDALRTFSLMPRQVVATGGGAVVRPINWKYMREGVTVYLDVPLDSLARRIAAVGTGSRPLLNFVSGDVYTKAFMGLFKISKKRSLAYENADATVYLQNIAAKLGVEDLSDITPTAITLEVLLQIENFLQSNNGMSIPMFP